MMKFKWLFFTISLLIILPGLFSLAKYGLKLSVDFTGGTRIEKNAVGEVVFSETVGPVIGEELKQNSFKAVGIASLAIIIYIAYAFREIAKPYSPWKWGVSAVIALLHDVLVVVGVFSILKVEIDALFVTALLTIIGFSVHDTIVVIDRIRENLRKTAGKVSFTEVVNDSIKQTLGRSIATSLTVVITLTALVLFGGQSIHWFIIALLVGIISGTYSSIFNAAPLLVIWEQKRGNGEKVPK